MISNIINKLIKIYIKFIDSNQLNLIAMVNSMGSCIHFLLYLKPATTPLYDLFCQSINARLTKELESDNINIPHGIIVKILINLNPITILQNDALLTKLIISIHARFITTLDPKIKLNIALYVLDLLHIITDVSYDVLVNIQEIINMLFANEITHTSSKIITSTSIRFVSDHAIFMYHGYLIEQRMIRDLNQLEQQQLQIIRRSAVQRGLSLPTQLPLLVMNMQPINEEGIAYEIHQIRNIIPPIRGVIESLIKFHEINVEYEGMSVDQLYVMLQDIINTLLPIEVDEYKHKCVNIALNILYDNYTPARKQFFNDLPYLLAVLKSDKITWNNSVATFNDRMLQVLLAFVDSAIAYGDIDPNNASSMN